MNSRNITLKYGLYGAIIGTVFYMLLVFSGNSPWGSASWMGSWIPGITAYFAVKTIKEGSVEDYFSFSSVFRISILTIFFQALFVNVITILLANILTINSLEVYRVEMSQNAEQIKNVFSEEMYSQLQLELQNLSHLTLAFWDFIYKIIGGLLVSLILARYLRKNKPIIEN